MNAVLLISHGSTSKETKCEVSLLAAQLREKCDMDIVEYAFLEIESPSIEEGIDICVKRGAKRIVILLNFLNSGKHVDRDIPAIVHRAQAKHKAIKMHITPPVGQHAKISDLFLDMISQAQNQIFSNP